MCETYQNLITAVGIIITLVNITQITHTLIFDLNVHASLDFTNEVEIHQCGTHGMVEVSLAQEMRPTAKYTLAVSLPI